MVRRLSELAVAVLSEWVWHACLPRLLLTRRDQAKSQALGRLAVFKQVTNQVT